MSDLGIQPIGVVRSPVANSLDLPRHGVPAQVEVFPEFAAGLKGIASSSHIIVIGWLHEADRHLLRVRRPRYDSAEPERGVFACRSPVRPNPLGITTVRLQKVAGNTLFVDELDMTDGTPVLDIKPHSAGFDGVFSARSARDLSPFADPDPRRAYESMVREAENFHGECCKGVALGAKMMYHVMKTFGVAQKEPGVQVTIGADGCAADAVQSLAGATFGSGRLSCHASGTFCFTYRGQELIFHPRPLTAGSMEEVLAMDVAWLFDIDMVFPRVPDATATAPQ